MVCVRLVLVKVSRHGPSNFNFIHLGHELDHGPKAADKSKEICLRTRSREPEARAEVAELRAAAGGPDSSKVGNESVGPRGPRDALGLEKIPKKVKRTRRWMTNQCFRLKSWTSSVETSDRVLQRYFGSWSPADVPSTICCYLICTPGSDAHTPTSRPG